MKKVPLVAAALLAVAVQAALDDSVTSDLGHGEEPALSSLSSRDDDAADAICERVRAGDWKCWDPACSAVCTKPRVTASVCLATTETLSFGTEHEINLSTSRAECVTLTYPSCCSCRSVDEVDGIVGTPDNDQSCVTYKTLKKMVGSMRDTNNRLYEVNPLGNQFQYVEVGECSKRRANGDPRAPENGCPNYCRQKTKRVTLLATREGQQQAELAQFRVNAYCSCQAN